MNYYKKKIFFKKPNDLLIQKKKISGILQEIITINNQKFLSLYRNFDIYCLRYDYGIYIKKKEKNLDIPIYTLDLTEQDKDFLTNYSNRNIIDITK